MQDQSISHETAKLAKEVFKDRNPLTAIPTQSLLQKWLREIQNIYIFCSPEIQYTREIDEDGNNPHYVPDGWYCEGHNSSHSLFYTKVYETYEEALEEGLKKALTSIDA